MKTIKQISAEAADGCNFCGPLKKGLKGRADHTYIYGFEHAKAAKIIEAAIREALTLQKKP